LLFVQDHAQMFSSAAAASVAQRAAAARASTGEELIVITVSRFPGAQTGNAVESEARRIFAQDGVHGTLLYVDRDDRRDAIVAEPAAWFSPARVAALKRGLETDFRLGEYDEGLERFTTAVLDVYAKNAPIAANRDAGAAPRLRIYALIAAALIAYLVLRGAVRREGA
jgi:uncharacterized membrane protein YgcG